MIEPTVLDILKQIYDQCEDLSESIGAVAHQGKDPVKCLDTMRCLQRTRFFCGQAMDAEVPDE